MQKFRHFEDFYVGEIIKLGCRTVRIEEILEFASEFDPQPFHLDEKAGKDSLLGGLAASGWHTASLAMRMLCDAFLTRSSSMGSPGIRQLKWQQPVLAGDQLSAQVEVLAARQSKSRPDMGIVDFRLTVSNQAGVVVLVQENPILFGLRGSAE